MRRIAHSPLLGSLVGAAVGLSLGVIVALFHLNAPVFVFMRVALSPSVSGLILGALTGMLLATAFACVRRLAGSTDSGGL